MKKFIEFCEDFWYEFTDALEFIFSLIIAAILGGVVIGVIIALNCAPVFLAIHCDNYLWLLAFPFTVAFTVAIICCIQDRAKDPQEIVKELEEATTTAQKLIEEMNKD